MKLARTNAANALALATGLPIARAKINISQTVDVDNSEETQGNVGNHKGISKDTNKTISNQNLLSTTSKNRLILMQMQKTSNWGINYAVKF